MKALLFKDNTEAVHFIDGRIEYEDAKEIFVVGYDPIKEEVWYAEVEEGVSAVLFEHHCAPRANVVLLNLNESNWDKM